MNNQQYKPKGASHIAINANDLQAQKQPARDQSPDLALGNFPHPPKGSGKGLRLTIENLDHLIRQSGIDLAFNVIQKKVVVRRGGKPCTVIDLVSVASRYGLNGTWLLPYVDELARRNPLNPVKDWIDSAPWDGNDRMPDILGTIHTVEDYPSILKEALVRRWLLSAVAAACLEGKRFSTRGVLTFQGPQGAGKTSWISNLMPPGVLRDTVIKRDHHLDGGNKDSVLGAIAHWITEIGELDSSFRKDVARLKGFLTNDIDKVRPPYGRHEVEYDRRTVFAATVNDENFLVDQTGNSRFWTIAVDRLDFEHNIDMQQLFAQLRKEFDEGGQWWLSQAEDEALAAYNLRHRAVSAIAERVKEAIDLEAIGKGKGVYMTAIELLNEIGVKNPSNVQCKEAGAVLRELLGPTKRHQGRDKWRVPKRSAWEAPQVEADEDEY